MRLLCSILVCAAIASAVDATPASSNEITAPAAAASVPTLATVTVRGVRPGPGLWKVSRGDHVLWVLGTVRHLPEQMQWRSAEVERVLAQSQELIEPPKVKLTANVGFFHKLLLLPSAYAARKLPDGLTLQQVLPPSIYARWVTLKSQYLGHSRSVERWRPIFAAMKLEKAALKAHGLRGSGDVTARVRALARQYGLKRTSTVYTVTIEHPRAAIDAFRRAGPGDITCFARTLQSVATDLPAMGARADAWAVGDVAALRTMPDSHYREACMDALVNAGFARTLGIADTHEKLAAIWLDAARTALRSNRHSFAVLPMHEVLASDGLLARLARQGYRVVAPDAAAGGPAAEGDISGPSPAAGGSSSLP